MIKYRYKLGKDGKDEFQLESKTKTPLYYSFEFEIYFQVQFGKEIVDAIHILRILLNYFLGGTMEPWNPKCVAWNLGSMVPLFQK